MDEIKNIFNDLPHKIPGEIVETILESKTIHIERIVSCAPYSMENVWYDQDEDEFVILLKGEAKIYFIDEDKEVSLKTGGYLNIPKHVKHRVTWIHPDNVTIWLAVFY